MSAIEHFIADPFSGETKKFREFELEIKEVLHTSNPLAVKFLFPATPWTLDANHIPTNLDSVSHLVSYPGIRMPTSQGMNNSDYQAAFTEWKEQARQNDKLDDCLVQLRKTLASRLTLTFLDKLKEIDNNLQLYHFWCELKKKHGYDTITVQTQGKDRLDCQAIHQLPGEAYITWLNRAEPEWNRAKMDDVDKIGLLLSDGTNKLKLRLITDTRLHSAVDHLNKQPGQTYESIKEYLQSAANQLSNTSTNTVVAPSGKVKAVKNKGNKPLNADHSDKMSTRSNSKNKSNNDNKGNNNNSNNHNNNNNANNNSNNNNNATNNNANHNSNNSNNNYKKRKYDNSNNQSNSHNNNSSSST